MTTSTYDITALAHTAIRGVLNQGGPSVIPSPYPGNAPVCAYHSPSGRRCVIGHILPDEFYDPLFERRNLQSLVTYEKDALPPYLVEHVGFFQELQKAHDDAWQYSRLYGEGFLPNFSAFAATTLLRWDIPLPEELLPFASATPRD